MPVYELYFPTEIFNVRTNFPQGYFIFYSEFILANIVILSSNVNYNSNSIVIVLCFSHEPVTRDFRRVEESCCEK